MKKEVLFCFILLLAGCSGGPSGYVFLDDQGPFSIISPVVTPDHMEGDMIQFFGAVYRLQSQDPIQSVYLLIDDARQQVSYDILPADNDKGHVVFISSPAFSPGDFSDGTHRARIRITTQQTDYEDNVIFFIDNTPPTCTLNEGTYTIIDCVDNTNLQYTGVSLIQPEMHVFSEYDGEVTEDVLIDRTYTDERHVTLTLDLRNYAGEKIFFSQADHYHNVEEINYDVP